MKKKKKKRKLIPEKARVLKSRMTPIKFSEAVESLSSTQKQAVQRMGLGSLLEVNIDKSAPNLNYYLLDHYDPLSNVLVLENGAVEITKERIHEMLGISKEGLNLNTLPSCDQEDKLLNDWKAQFPSKKYSNTAFLTLIKRSNVDNQLFRLNFLMLFINTFVESKLMGTNNIQALDKLVLIEDYSRIDWCNYILQSLQTRKEFWKKEDPNCYYTGPITVLLVSTLHIACY